jgi:beta-phosphoglucomutase-like phosphatase (HAD superfamily)
VSSAIDAGRVEALLCDADGNLFPSEEPAFVASTEVTNRLLAEAGSERRFTPDELRRLAVGRNFRSTALALAEDLGLALDPPRLEQYVIEEKAEVTAHLGTTLRPDPSVTEPLERLGGRFGLAAVSSSALSRLDACFRATALDGLFPDAVRFSAEDSLPVPTSKPDPAVYLHALARLGVPAGATLAVEDAVPGVASAVGAGIPCVGNLVFVPPPERAARRTALTEAGAQAVVDSWAGLEELLSPAQ